MESSHLLEGLPGVRPHLEEQPTETLGLTTVQLPHDLKKPTPLTPSPWLLGQTDSWLELGRSEALSSNGGLGHSWLDAGRGHDGQPETWAAGGGVQFESRIKKASL